MKRFILVAACLLFFQGFAPAGAADMKGESDLAQRLLLPTMSGRAQEEFCLTGSLT
jgi:hypothetical protein